MALKPHPMLVLERFCILILHRGDSATAGDNTRSARSGGWSAKYWLLH